MANIPKLPALPSVPADSPPELQSFLNAAKSILDNLTGGGGTAYVSQDDLTTFAGQVPSLAEQATSSAAVSGGAVGEAPPPPLEGLRVTAGFAYVVLEWDTLPYGDAAYTIIYRATVDDFSQATPIGTSRYLIYSDYVPNYQEYYYWISSVSDAGVEGPPNSQDGTKAASAIDTQFVLEQIEKALSSDQIAVGGLDDENIFAQAIVGTAMIKNAAIIDAHIQTIGADKIVANSLSALSANLGQITAGAMRSPDGTFIIDLDTKHLIIAGPNGQSADTYTILKNGVLETWYWTGSSHSLAKSLTHIEVGTAENDTWVLIPGTFLASPKVMVSPGQLQCYDATYAAQDQILNCQAIGLQETAPGSKQWQFKALAQLQLPATTVNTPVNLPYSGSGALTTGTFTTPANTTSVQLYFSARSTRGTGSVSTGYYYRSVYFQVYGRVAGSGSYVLKHTTGNYALPANVDGNSLLNISFAATLGSAASYQFYVVANYFDTDGTAFTTAQAPYEYATDTVTAPNITESIDIPGSLGPYNQSKVVKAVLPTYSPPADWAVYQAVYSWDYECLLQVDNFPPYNACAGLSYCNYTYTLKSLSKLPARTISTGTLKSQVNLTDGPGATLSYYDKDYLSGSISVVANIPENRSYYPRYQATGSFKNVSVAISRRKAVLNSTTAINTLNYLSYTSNLTGGTVVANGTLNWQAVG